jgi:fumarate hydratase, class II
MSKTRLEKDSFGEIEVSADRLWGAQTQRSLKYFTAGPVWPREVIQALGIVKKAAALTNAELDRIDEKKAEWIVKASDEIGRASCRERVSLHV